MKKMGRRSEDADEGLQESPWWDHERNIGSFGEVRFLWWGIFN